MAPRKKNEPLGKPPYRLAVIFTGHMIDLPDRPVPRFPPKLESVAADVIRLRVGALSQLAAGSLVGITQGARGGDILFLETCHDLGLDTRMVLPEPPEAFIGHSVAGASSGDWPDRFDAVWRSHAEDERSVHVPPPGANIYEAANEAELMLARKLGAEVRLLAFWDGQGGDGPGGTESFVRNVEAAGGALDHIDAAELLRRYEAAGL
ncbi:MAG: hypothetical protein R3D57_14275 [Hyphomicrobiaceae bacterium]